MNKITLGFKAYDLHELACHFIAKHAGLYVGRGLDVELLDTRRIPDGELPEDLFSVACGTAAMRWLRGEALKVVFVVTDKPMFWLYTADRLRDISELRNQRIAAYPDVAPPARFLRIILREAGLNPDKDIGIEAAANDAERLSMLRDGTVHAALVSAAIVPERVQELGFRQFLCLGDRIRLPTTGLAITSTFWRDEPELVIAMRECFLAALRLAHSDEAVLRSALREFDSIPDRLIGNACTLVRNHFGNDGLTAPADIGHHIRQLAEELAIPLPANPGNLYDSVMRHPDVGVSDRA